MRDLAENQAPDASMTWLEIFGRRRALQRPTPPRLTLRSHHASENIDVPYVDRAGLDREQRIADEVIVLQQAFGPRVDV